jgi:hypothetical protein
MLAEWLAEATRNAAAKRAPAVADEVVPPLDLPYRGKLVVDGVQVQVDVVSGRYAEVRARAVSGRAPRMMRRRSWPGSNRPPHADELALLPRIAHDTHGDDLAASALPSMAASWLATRWKSPSLVIVSDGLEVVAWLDQPGSTDEIQSAIEAVIAIARWDATLASMLAALPDAQLLADADLSPAVVLAPGDVRVGCRAGALVVELGGRSRRVEPEPWQILAAVSALRTEAAAGTPYR